MSYPVVYNPVTRERGIVRHPPSVDHPRLNADLYAAPGAAVVGEHIHPNSTECFTVVRGELRLRLNGKEQSVQPGNRVVITPNTPHDWWNAGTETAYVILEVDPGQRFEAMIRNLFGLASDGKTDDTGRPSLLQAALLGREFDDVIRFTSPPRVIQRPLFAALAPIARIRGLRGSYPQYLNTTGESVPDLEPLPDDITALIPGL
jgi:quercetin dioxygenase-like cupin family protein